MTPQQCTKLQNGQKGMRIPILPSLVQASNCQHRQDNLIHLADASSHGVADCRTRSLSSQLPSNGHGSSAKDNHLRVIHSSSNKTRIYENSMVNATPVVVQGTKHRSVGPNRSKLAEVTSLKECSRNLLTGWDQAHIIREMNKRATREE